MTLRHALVGWLALLGLGALSLSATLLVGHVIDHRALQTRAQAAADRSALLTLVHATLTEELAALEALLGKAVTLQPDLPREHDHPTLPDTDTALARAKARFVTAETADMSRLLDLLEAGLKNRRGYEADLLARPGPVPADRLEAWQTGLATETRALDLLMLRLVSAPSLPDTALPDTGLDSPRLRAVEVLRRLGLQVYSDLLVNRLTIEVFLARHAKDGTPLLSGTALALRGRSTADIGTIGLAFDHARAAPGPDTDPALQALDLLSDIYQPAENRLLDTLQPGGVAGPHGIVEDWRSASRNTMRQFVHAEMELSLTGKTLLAAESRSSRAGLAGIGLLTLGAALLFGFSLRFVDRRILHPLALLRQRIEAAAAGRAQNPPRLPDPFAEFAAVEQALDCLGAAGRSHRHTQAEIARLGDRLAAENRQLLADLEAAAKVQRNQLPATPFAVPGAMLHALYRPSRIIAGDSFDTVSRPDGRSVTFLIDVTGHGAPAALISVASHIALRQALHSAPVTEPLADIIARVNSDWAEHLPYFTLIAVETDPATATARVVQCGHPALIRLPAGGGLHLVGQGGLPIGVLPDAEFTTLTCPFLSGDRLVLVTDGVSDAADPSGRPFGEAAFHALLETTRNAPVATLFQRLGQALWDWAGSEILDDDVTILVLEAR